MNDKNQKLCKLYKCQNSVVIQHLNGNTLDNRVANLKVIGYLPPGNHRVSEDCRAGQWDAPTLSKRRIDVIRSSGRTTDIDLNRNEEGDEGIIDEY